MEEIKVKKGRYNNKPNYYQSDEGILLLENWCRTGYTNADICKMIGINVSTLYDWRKKFPKIDIAMRATKEIADIHVENALFKRCIGYEYDEIHTEKRYNADGTFNNIEKKIKKQMPPEVNAILFWLKNRRPELWKERKSIDEDLTNTQPITVYFNDKEKIIIDEKNLNKESKKILDDFEDYKNVE